MQKLLEYILDNSLQLKQYNIIQEAHDGQTVYTLKVNKDQVGLVIGKQGNTIKAIRRLLKVKATLDNIRVDLMVSSDEV